MIKKNTKILVWFEYHCWESDQSSDANLWKHTHQIVIVLSKLKDQDVPMYHVIFSDGLEADVFSDELLKSKKDFQRPDYVSRC